jgi:hypothetical protein
MKGGSELVERWRGEIVEVWREKPRLARRESHGDVSGSGGGSLGIGCADDA